MVGLPGSSPAYLGDLNTELKKRLFSLRCQMVSPNAIPSIAF